MSSNGTGIEVRLGYLEANHMATHRDVTAIMAAMRVHGDDITEVREISHKVLAKLNVLENMLQMLQGALASPEPKPRKSKT
jgi:hypothetical protein